MEYATLILGKHKLMFVLCPTCGFAMQIHRKNKYKVHSCFLCSHVFVELEGDDENDKDISP